MIEEIQSWGQWGGCKIMSGEWGPAGLESASARRVHGGWGEMIVGPGRAGSPTDAIRSQQLLLGRHTASEEELQERKGGSEANKVRVKEQISEMGNRVPGLAGGRRQGLFEMSCPGGHGIGGCRENRCGQRTLRWPCRILHTLVFLPP